MGLFDTLKQAAMATPRRTYRQQPVEEPPAEPAFQSGKEASAPGTAGFGLQTFRQGVNPMQPTAPVNPLNANLTADEANEAAQAGRAAIQAKNDPTPEILYNEDTGETTPLATTPAATTAPANNVPLTTGIRDARAPAQPDMPGARLDKEIELLNQREALQGQQVQGTVTGQRHSSQSITKVDEDGWLARYRATAEQAVEQEHAQREGFIAGLTGGLYGGAYNPQRAYAAVIYNAVNKGMSADTQAALKLYDTAVAQYGHSIQKLSTMAATNMQMQAALEAKNAEIEARLNQQYFSAGRGSTWQAHAAGEVVDTSAHTGDRLQTFSTVSKDRLGEFTKNTKDMQARVDQTLERARKAPDRVKTSTMVGTVQALWMAEQSGTVDFNEALNMMSSLALDDELWSAADLAYASQLENQYGMNKDAARRMMLGMRIPGVREKLVAIAKANADPQRDPRMPKQAWGFCNAIFNSRDIAAAVDNLGTRDGLENYENARMVRMVTPKIARYDPEGLGKYVADTQAQSDMAASFLRFRIPMNKIDQATGQPVLDDNLDGLGRSADIFNREVAELKKSEDTGTRIIGQYLDGGFDTVETDTALDQLQKGTTMLGAAANEVSKQLVEAVRQDINEQAAGFSKLDPAMQQEFLTLINDMRKGNVKQSMRRRIEKAIPAGTLKQAAEALAAYDRVAKPEGSVIDRERYLAAMRWAAMQNVRNKQYRINIGYDVLAAERVAGRIASRPDGTLVATNLAGYTLEYNPETKQPVMVASAAKVLAAELYGQCKTIMKGMQNTVDPKTGQPVQRSLADIKPWELLRALENQLATNPDSIAWYKLSSGGTSMKNLMNQTVGRLLAHEKEHAVTTPVVAAAP